VKPHHAVRPGDKLTFAIGDTVQVIRIEKIPPRRGPSSEAQNCYDLLQGQENQPHGKEKTSWLHASHIDLGRASE